MSKDVLPDYFKPILWSYNFCDLDPEKDKKVIIVNAVNYGDLRHWKWLKERYNVADILSRIPTSELRERSQRLAGLVFKIKFKYAIRSTR